MASTAKYVTTGLLGAGAVFVLAAWAPPATAQEDAYPTRPIRFLAGAAAGGGLDITLRTLQPTLTAGLGQQIVIDNRGGASGSVAADLLVRASPDGYTVLLGAIANLAVNPHVLKGIGYLPLRDFAPVTFAVSGANVLIGHPSLPAGALPELIALARAKPSTIAYGSSGTGSAGHLAGELFSTMANVKLTHVPYKGGAPAMTALFSNEVRLLFASPPTAIPQVKAGRVRAYGVTTLKRSAVLPELPTIAELGLPGFEVTNWYGVVLPAKTPRSVIRRLNVELTRALLVPQHKEALLRLGLEPQPSTPEAFGAFMKSEFEKWGKLLAAAGITAN